MFREGERASASRTDQGAVPPAVSPALPPHAGAQAAICSEEQQAWLRHEWTRPPVYGARASRSKTFGIGSGSGCKELPDFADICGGGCRCIKDMSN